MSEDGRISEWNEGNFKSLRLHEIKEMIAYFKLNPFDRTSGQFHYYWWLRGVEALLSEGKQKYKEKEKRVIDNLNDACNECLINFPPHQKFISTTFKGATTTYRIIDKNYNHFAKLLKLFEDTVRDLNDSHGLDTRNREASGLF